MLLQKKNRKKFFIYSILLLILIIGTNNLLIVFNFPEEINVIKGQSQKIGGGMLFNLELDEKQSSISMKTAASKISTFASLYGSSNGSVNADLKFLGLFPVKKVTLNVIPDIKVIPSGEAIGVRIESKGLLIVGLSSINNVNGRKYSPAADAGLEVGDTLLKIDGYPVEYEKDVINYLNNRQNKEKKVIITIQRGDALLTKIVQPVQCEDDNLYKIGLWVRDQITGIGTMTFYDPKTMTFAALGHGITDIDSGALVDINSGTIMKSKVAAIQKARKTVPGEIIGIFSDNINSYGIIEKNTNYGIYGKLAKSQIDSKNKPMPIGLSYQVKEGPAKILATINGNQIEEYDIEITKVNRQPSADSKSMAIRITDPRLLEKTGGIVQGMSGSPIIQNGKLVGAVTHVLINEPTRGYGIFIEWMLSESKITSDNYFKAASGE